MPRQDSLTDQMNDLMQIAVREGMYDAHDWLREHFKGEVLTTFEPERSLEAAERRRHEAMYGD